MAKKSAIGGCYYYAGGEKIELVRADDLLAVEGNPARPARGAPSPIGRALTDSLRLVHKDEIPSAQKPGKSKYPVFRSHGAIVVAMPEVRVEESRESERAKLDKWLAEHEHDVTVVSRDDDRVVLRPVSGSGEDALTIANALAEKIGPEMAQARFIRVTTRPVTGGG
jgi:hypothetical protein